MISLETIFTGPKRWEPWERSIWLMSVLGAIVWVAYVLVSDILLFQPQPMYAYERGYTTHSFSDFGEFIQELGQRPSSSDIAILEGRRTRNEQKQKANIEIAKFNDNDYCK